jgi:hypothetical protein
MCDVGKQTKLIVHKEIWNRAFKCTLRDATSLAPMIIYLHKTFISKPVIYTKQTHDCYKKKKLLKYTHVRASLAFEIVCYMFCRKWFEVWKIYSHRNKQTAKEGNRHANILLTSGDTSTFFFFCKIHITFNLWRISVLIKCTRSRSLPEAVSYASVELRKVLISHKQMTRISINLRRKSHKKKK